ncbi:hypothetical protein QBC42DRAFT_279549 [Cladorrhinum samala]|uniref:Uncharacterized protein n=1 Tax=Cladorrhinum samala TaxID=585594 RepID=A0AAV9H9K7_9PEZI|nr:hypothetical protein QBC42DRAFT_279549 [Cladorrhinum samala]
MGILLPWVRVRMGVAPKVCGADFISFSYFFFGRVSGFAYVLIFLSFFFNKAKALLSLDVFRRLLFRNSFSGNIPITFFFFSNQSFLVL